MLRPRPVARGDARRQAPRGSDEGSGATGMMVTARVADSWGGQGEAPFSAPQAKKKIEAKVPFY